MSPFAIVVNKQTSNNEKEKMTRGRQKRKEREEREQNKREGADC